MKRPAICISGPPGAGKSTVAKYLSNTYVTYLEKVSQNPHLEALVTSMTEFDAAANQRWFLERVGGFLKAADPTCGLVIDQDPAAIVKVYGKMFYEEGRMTTAQYRELLVSLGNIEQRLSDWREPRQGILLDASPELLRERIVRSRGDPKAPSVAWLSRIMGYFREWVTGLPSFTTITTDQLNAQQVIKLVAQHIIHT